MKNIKFIPLIFFLITKTVFGQSITVTGFNQFHPYLQGGNFNGTYNLETSLFNGKNSYIKENSTSYPANGCQCSGRAYLRWSNTNSRWEFIFITGQNFCSFCNFAGGTYFTNTSNVGNVPPCGGWTNGGNIAGGCGSSTPPDPPVISASATTVCAGTGINLTATSCANTVNWSDGGIGLTRNNVVFNANITLTATCNNGLASANSNSISIVVNPTPSLTVSNPASVAPSATVDITAAAVIIGSTLYGASITYHTDMAGFVTLPNPAAVAVSNTYYIKATTTAGCSDIKPVIVVISDCGTALVLQSTADDYSSGTYLKKTNETISATNTVSGTANVTYRSNKSITLSPLANGGFKAENGVVFKAEIGGCD